MNQGGGFNPMPPAVPQRFGLQLGGHGFNQMANPGFGNVAMNQGQQFGGPMFGGGNAGMNQMGHFSGQNYGMNPMGFPQMGQNFGMHHPGFIPQQQYGNQGPRMDSGWAMPGMRFGLQNNNMNMAGPNEWPKLNNQTLEGENKDVSPAKKGKVEETESSTGQKAVLENKGNDIVKDDSTGIEDENSNRKSEKTNENSKKTKSDKKKHKSILRNKTEDIKFWKIPKLDESKSSLVQDIDLTPKSILSAKEKDNSDSFTFNIKSFSVKKSNWSKPKTQTTGGEGDMKEKTIGSNDSRSEKIGMGLRENEMGQKLVNDESKLFGPGKGIATSSVAKEQVENKQQPASLLSSAFNPSQIVQSQQEMAGHGSGNIRSGQLDNRSGIMPLMSIGTEGVNMGVSKMDSVPLKPLDNRSGMMPLMRIGSEGVNKGVSKMDFVQSGEQLHSVPLKPLDNRSGIIPLMSIGTEGVNKGVSKMDFVQSGEQLHSVPLKRSVSFLEEQDSDEDEYAVEDQNDSEVDWEDEDLPLTAFNPLPSQLVTETGHTKVLNLGKKKALGDVFSSRFIKGKSLVREDIDPLGHGTSGVLPDWVEKSNKPSILSIEFYPPIDPNSIGSRLLMKMGWRPGTGLGVKRTGIQKPVTAIGRMGGRHGLGGLPFKDRKKMKKAEEFQNKPFDPIQTQEGRDTMIKHAQDLVKHFNLGIKSPVCILNEYLAKRKRRALYKAPVGLEETGSDTMFVRQCVVGGKHYETAIGENKKAAKMAAAARAFKSLIRELYQEIGMVVPLDMETELNKVLDSRQRKPSRWSAQSEPKKREELLISQFVPIDKQKLTLSPEVEENVKKFYEGFKPAINALTESCLKQSIKVEFKEGEGDDMRRYSCKLFLDDVEYGSAYANNKKSAKNDVGLIGYVAFVKDVYTNADKPLPKPFLAHCRLGLSRLEQLETAAKEKAQSLRNQQPKSILKSSRPFNVRNDGYQETKSRWDQGPYQLQQSEVPNQNQQRSQNRGSWDQAKKPGMRGFQREIQESKQLPSRTYDSHDQNKHDFEPPAWYYDKSLEPKYTRFQKSASTGNMGDYGQDSKPANSESEKSNTISFFEAQRLINSKLAKEIQEVEQEEFDYTDTQADNRMKNKNKKKKKKGPLKMNFEKPVKKVSLSDLIQQHARNYGRKVPIDSQDTGKEEEEEEVVEQAEESQKPAETSVESSKKDKKPLNKTWKRAPKAASLEVCHAQLGLGSLLQRLADEGEIKTAEEAAAEMEDTSQEDQQDSSQDDQDDNERNQNHRQNFQWNKPPMNSGFKRPASMGSVNNWQAKQGMSAPFQRQEAENFSGNRQSGNPRFGRPASMTALDSRGVQGSLGSRLKGLASGYEGVHSQEEEYGNPGFGRGGGFPQGPFQGPIRMNQFGMNRPSMMQNNWGGGPPRMPVRPLLPQPLVFEQQRKQLFGIKTPDGTLLHPPSINLISQFQSGGKKPIGLLKDYCQQNKLKLTFKAGSFEKWQSSGVFERRCEINGKLFEMAEGSSKKEAEDEAALLAFRALLQEFNLERG